MYTEKEYATAAKEYDVPVAAVKTVIDVEASGEGFLKDGRSKILFEAHYFRDRTGGIYDHDHPTISAPYPQSRAYYLGNEAEYDRLAEARALNEPAALESASWGAGQVMGANWRSLKYNDVYDLVENMKTKEGQLDAMMRYIKTNGLDRHMRRFPAPDAFARFAAGYNGQAAVDAYVPKLAKAWKKHAANSPEMPAAPPVLRRGDKGDAVKELQAALKIQPVDGDFGPRTEGAVVEFQINNGLEGDGIVGPKTREILFPKKKG